MYEDEDLSRERLKEEYQDDYYWYKLYDSGLLLQGGKAQTTNGKTKVSMYRAFTTENYSIEIKDITPQVKYKPTTYKRVQVLDADEDYIDYICPINKTVHTQGIPNPPISILKGPTKSATVDLVTVENNVGTGGTANVDGITLNLAVNQFIRLKVDVKGAKINGLPQGFTFANDEITGAGTTAGSYRCNIVTEAVSIPVRINISNVIRIS